MGENLRGHHDKPPAGFQNAAFCDEGLALSGCQKIDFHLGRQHFVPVRQGGERGIAGRGIAQRECQPGMGEAVLLAGEVENGRTDVNAAVVDVNEFGPECLHQGLR